MRRADREITDFDDIVSIMRRCDVCRLALNDGDYPYILPLNFGMDVQDGKITLYFHSATEGYKTELFARNSRASFEMDCGHQLQYFRDAGRCTMAYESVIGRGTIRVLGEEQKLEALKKLMGHYHPENDAYFNPAAVSRTLVYTLEVESLTGKRKNPK